MNHDLLKGATLMFVTSVCKVEGGYVTMDALSAFLTWTHKGSFVESQGP